MAVQVPAVAPRVPRRIPLWIVALVFWGAVLAIGVARSVGLPQVPVFTTSGIVFTSIVIEALPFVLIGAVVSGVLAEFVPDTAFGRLARLPRAIQVPAAAVAGVGFPVCECGSVPVGRRLLLRGVDPAAGIAFMLAAPILNPLVLASTWVAYQGRGAALEMTAARAVLGLVIAVAVALIAARALPLRSLAETPIEGHDHGSARGGRAGRFADHVIGDFLFMGKFLVLGAAVSALIQAVLPQSLLAGIGGAPVLSALTMIGLAFALSLCSEADAFVALSFTAFPLSSQLAFLVAGPMLDTKLAVLYGAAFSPRFTALVAAVAVPATVAGALLFGWVT